MTFTEVVEEISKQTHYGRDEINNILRHTILLIEKTAIKGEAVHLVRLGKFTSKVSKPRMAFGKMTTEKTTIKFTPYDSVAVKK